MRGVRRRAHEEVTDLRDLLAVLHPDTDVDGVRVVEVATSRAGRRSFTTPWHGKRRWVR